MNSKQNTAIALALKSVGVSQSIKTILSESGFTLIGPSEPENPHELARAILESLPVFDSVRKNLFHKDAHIKMSNTAFSSPIVELLLEKKWLKRDGHHQLKLAIDEVTVHRYLNGIWLEELVWYMMRDQGADEVLLSQKIYWEHNGVKGHNEIDVIARFGSELTFVSCKTRGPGDTKKATVDLSHQVYEASYWKQHFLKNMGQVLLATTLDLIDEDLGERERFPLARARANLLGVDIWGYEMLLQK